jgi:hypothetical protein
MSQFNPYDHAIGAAHRASLGELTKAEAIKLQSMASVPSPINETFIALASARLQDRCAALYSFAERLESIANRVFGEDAESTGGAVNALCGSGEAGRLDNAFNCTDLAMSRIERAVSRLERV